MRNGLMTLDWHSVFKGLIVAVLTGAFLPIAAAVQTPGFDIHMVNWASVWVLAENGAIVGFVGYIVKEFFTDNTGHFLGIGKPKEI